jgi:hypothetical protein
MRGTISISFMPPVLDVERGCGMSGWGANPSSSPSLHPFQPSKYEGKRPCHLPKTLVLFLWCWECPIFSLQTWP